jgi:hypothetical protein
MGDISGKHSDGDNLNGISALLGLCSFLEANSLMNFLFAAVTTLAHPIDIFSTKYVALTTEHHDESSTEKLLPSEHPTSRTGPRKITLTLNWSTMFCCILVWALSVAVLERFVSALRHPPYLRGIDMSDGEFGASPALS